MRPLDLRTQLGIGDRPQSRDALIGAEGHVQTGRSPLAARVASEFTPGVRCEAVIQPVEVAAIDLAAVRKSEQAIRIEPDAIRFFSRCVVLIGMTKGALALQVIRSRCGLGQSGYHDASPVTTLPDRDTTWPEYSRNMTVVALMIPALGIPVFYRGLTKWPCDLYKSGQNSLHLSRSKYQWCSGVRRLLLLVTFRERI